MLAVCKKIRQTHVTIISVSAVRVNRKGTVTAQENGVFNLDR